MKTIILKVEAPDHIDANGLIRHLNMAIMTEHFDITELPIPTDPEIKQMADEYASQMIGVGGCDENMIQGNARKDYIKGIDDYKKRIGL